MRRHERWGKGAQIVWHFLVLSVWLCVCFSAGYGLSLLLFRITGQPAALVRHIISSLLGLAVMWLAMFVRRHLPGGQGGPRLDGMIDAMNRIARGDFSVWVPVDAGDPLSELAESVNQMARELGSMEELRQEFISNVSHEIQSPLTSISGFAALMRNGALPAEQQNHYLEIIETEAKRLSRLSDNMLKLSSLENDAQALTVRAFSLDRQLRNAVLMLEPQWVAKTLNVELSLEKTTLSGDEALLSQVWINLLHNAVKFTPENGQIAISLNREGDRAVCRVSDTGAGIAPEDRPHIFERFYKADKARDRSLGGNGLGLSLVKKIVDIHGGTVTAESEPGKGSVFTVSLPL